MNRFHPGVRICLLVHVLLNIGTSQNLETLWWPKGTGDHMIDLLDSRDPYGVNRAVSAPDGYWVKQAMRVKGLPYLILKNSSSEISWPSTCIWEDRFWWKISLISIVWHPYWVALTQKLILLEKRMYASYTKIKQVSSWIWSVSRKI